MFAMLFILAFAMGKLTLQPDESIIVEEESSQKSLVLRGIRGKILANKGEPLAYDEQSYNIQFYRESAERKDEAWRPYYTRVFQEAIAVIESYGGKTIDTFSLKKDPETGTFQFNWGNLGISDDTQLLQAQRDREKNWRTNMQIRDTDSHQYSPEEIYQELRTRFYIPEEVSYEEARKLLSIWQEIQLASSSISPVTIAVNVPKEVVGELESRSSELDGLHSSETTRRVYPKGSLLGNIIGYTSRIISSDNYAPEQGAPALLNLVHYQTLEVVKDNQKPMLKDQGYAMEDLIGRQGLEKSMESYLTGSTKQHHGEIVYEVTRRGNRTRRISQKAPTNGNNVYTTLDLGLQETAEKALIQNIADIEVMQQEEILNNQEEYLEKRDKLTDIKTASQGAVVVLDVNSGKVLAIVGYPNYDNNLFVGGISEAEWKKITELDEKDINVMSNLAIGMPTMPGSIFKMSIGLAGLEEGVITREEQIDDEGEYTAPDAGGEAQIKTNPPHCWAWPFTYKEHTHQSIDVALQNSCNYYFFEVANRLKIEKINDWAGTKLGMAKPSGIELGEELVGQIGGQDVIFDKEKELNQQRSPIPKLVYWRLIEMLEGYRIDYVGPAQSDEEQKVRDEQNAECALALMQLTGVAEPGPQIRQVLDDYLGIPVALSNSKNWTQQINDMLGQMSWNLSQTVRTGIGQAVTKVTPIAAARYLAALVNGGTLYEAHLIDRIVDQNGMTVMKKEPVIEQQLNADPANLEIIKKGMGRVVSEEDGGTAGAAFENYKYQGKLGGKTGTAQISEAKNIIAVENTAWMVAFAPYDKPEIAIAVCIPNGWKGSNCAPTVREIISYWLDRKNENIRVGSFSPNEILR